MLSGIFYVKLFVVLGINLSVTHERMWQYIKREWTKEISTVVCGGFGVSMDLEVLTIVKNEVYFSRQPCNLYVDQFHIIFASNISHIHRHSAGPPI